MTTTRQQQSRAFDSIRVPPIDSFKRTRIERRRLWRILDKVSVPATPVQLQRFAKMKRSVLGSADDSKVAYFGMNAVTLTTENIRLLEPTGFFTAKADGLGGLAVWPTTAGTQTGDDDRCDTMLFVTRNSQIRAINHVPLFVDKAVILDAEMCLCRRKLNNDEFWRLTNGFDVHKADPLDYYTFLDASAIAKHGAAYDIASDEHQEQYDSLHELCCAAFDCIMYGPKCTSMTYRDRIALVNDLLETVFVQQTMPRKRRMAAIQTSIDNMGGADVIPLRLFLKPVVPMHCIHSAFHALQPALYGVRVDGVVFMRAEQMYEIGFAASVLKWKPPHAQTLDLTIVASFDEEADRRCYLAFIINADSVLIQVSTHVLDDTEVAAKLLADYANTTAVLRRSCTERLNVLECQPVLAGGIDEPGASESAALQRKLWWRPVEWREEKTRPNSRANYEGVCRALLKPISEIDIIAAIRERPVAVVDDAAATAASLLPLDEDTAI